MLAQVISDTHMRHRSIKIDPSIDLLIHCGDFSNSPNLIDNNVEANDFIDWWNRIDVQKILIPGNHDLALYHGWINKDDFKNTYVLIDQSIYLNGIKFYGSPWTPTFGSDRWVYNKARGKMREIWYCVANDVDVLLTHGPPQGFLDLTRDYEGNGRQKIQVGCKSLANTVLSSKIKIHCFGHIHSERDIYNSGILQSMNKTFINASVCDIKYDLINDGYIITL